MLKKIVILSLIFILSINSFICFAKETSAVAQLTNQKPPAQELKKLADDLMVTVSKIRGLNFKHQITKKVTNQNEVRSIMLKELQNPENMAKLDGEGKMLIKLGLLPENFDYRKFLVDLYVEQIAGFYVPENKIIYIADWMSMDMQPSILSHELTHALQDQYFDLTKVLKPDYNRSDMNMAKTSVVEGEATMVMLEYMIKDYGFNIYELPNFSMVQFQDMMPYSSSTEAKLLATAPAVISDTMTFPYLYGTDFIMSFVKKYGWKQVASIYAAMPQSSEQIMHPEKYMSAGKDCPVKIELNNIENALGSGWKKINTDVLGEYVYYILLRELSGKNTATIASSGWGGDQIQCFQNGSSVMVIMMTLWDTEKDGHEFFDAYNKAVTNKYSREQMEDKGSNYFLWSTEDKYVYSGINGKKVLIIEGVPEEIIYKLLKTCSFWK